MQEIEQKYIKITPNLRALLVYEFNCAESTIHNALFFNSFSQKADRIRKEAIRRGGIITTRKKIVWTNN